MPVAFVPDEKAAITKAIKGARPWAFITVICDSVPRSIACITELRQEDGLRALLQEHLNVKDMEV